MQDPSTANAKSVPEFLSGGGEMGRRIREYNWALTPLANVEKWPQSLQTVLSICLNSNFPIAIYWGPGLTLIYNDAWSPIPGNKHPWSLGRPAKEVWPEIWDAIEPQFRKTFKGEPGGSKDALLPMQRHGYTEECYFDFTFTPVYGEAGKVEGVFNAVIETTYRLIAERRTSFLKNLTLQIASAKTKASLFEQAISLLKDAAADVPFASIYTSSDKGIKLAASTLPFDQTAPTQIKPWPFEEMLQSGKAVHIENLEAHLHNVPVVFWPEKLQEACILPLMESSGANAGFLVCGISARRRFDEEYKSFLVAVSNAIGTVYNTIASLEEERKRTEALAELDRSKTTFFSNISHEFRTPLTLMLGPIEDALNDPGTIPANQVRLDVAHRNGLRLQKLVNTLLQFSRIEAGRVEGKFVQVDICAFTQDLASTFRSAVEKAGMALNIYCGEVKDEVYVDTDMWEKVVLNLVSNAFKYSNDGSIDVAVSQEGNELRLTVTDSGVGIPEMELEKIFDRFHRVENLGGRSQEGSGIGLALVKELVKQHGGNISVQSTVGKGSRFTVAIPVGKAHLPPASVGKANAAVVSSASEAFVQEAMKWVPQTGQDENTPNDPADDNNSAAEKHSVLLADDNRDMRDYIQRLLAPQFEVVTAADGEDAFGKALAKLPDLVLSDVMMPKLDGFGLLKRLRETEPTKNIPVIFLSARAGEEAKVEGLSAGADDYLVKPFSARELVARVDAQIRLRRSREKALRDLYTLFDEVPFAVAVLMGESLTIEFINQYNLEIWQRKKEEVIGRPLFDVFPGNRADAEPIHKNIYKTGERFTANELPIDLTVNGKTETRWFNTVIDPLRNEDGRVIGQLATTIEVTEQVLARKKIEESEERLQTALQGGELGLFDFYPQTGSLTWSAKAKEFFGLSADVPVSHETYLKGLHPDDREEADAAAERALAGAGNGHYENEYRTIGIEDGKLRWVRSKGKISFDEEGKAIRFTGVTQDITEWKKAEELVRLSEKQFRDFSNNIQNLAWMANSEGWIFWYNQRWYDYTGTTLEEMQGNGREKVHHPDYFDRVTAIVSEAWRKPEPFEFTSPLRGADGVYRWFLTRAEPILNEEGKIIRWIGTNTNIDEQVKARQKVEASEARFRTLIEEAPVATCLFTGREMKIEIANEKIIAFMGKGASVLGKPLAEAIPELVGQPFLQELDKVFTTGQTYENRSARGDLLVNGVLRTFYFDYIFKPLKNAEGQVYAILDITIDVTDHVLARRELEKSEQRFRTLAEALPQMVWMRDMDGNIEYASNQWEEYSGIKDVNKAWRWMTHPDDWEPVMSAWQESFASGNPFRYEVRMRNKAGEYRWHYTVAEPVTDEEGKTVKWIGAITDIHEQKTFTEKLEGLVAERTKELYRSNEDLQQFAHVASHDLKEPLRKIRTFASRLKEEYGDGMEEREKVYFAKMENAAERMYSMIDGVLSYSSVNAMEQATEPVDLNVTLRNIQNDLEVLIAQKKASFEYKKMPVLEGSPVLLYQLFYNLVYNALKFSKAGVAPVIKMAAETCTQDELKKVSLGNKGGVKIIIQDNGIGFDNSDAERIFQSFARLNSKDKYEGTGLGLALCKKIVERHGGAIWATGMPGEGATFTLLLPLANSSF